MFSSLLGSSPLHSATEGCQLAKVQQLVQKGANVDAQDKEGCTPLHIAARRGYDTIAKELLDRHATASTANQEQRTPVHEAARNGHAAVLSLLLGSRNQRDSTHTKQALLNSSDKTGQTPLTLALYNRHLGVARELIRLGADPNRKDLSGCTAFISAVRKGDLDIMAALFGDGHVVSLETPRTSAEGWTPLHVAAACNQEMAAQWLVDRGASLVTVDNDARTPQDVAQANGHFGLVRMLRTAAIQRGGVSAPVAEGPFSPSSYNAYNATAGKGDGRSKLQLLAETFDRNVSDQARQQGVAGAHGAQRTSDGGASASSAASASPFASAPSNTVGGVSLSQQWAQQQQRLAAQGPVSVAYPPLPAGAGIYH